MKRKVILVTFVFLLLLPVAYMEGTREQKEEGKGDLSSLSVAERKVVRSDKEATEELSLEESPILREERILVPLKEVLAMEDVGVDWNEEERKASAETEEWSMEVTESGIKIDEEEKESDVPPEIRNDTLFFPLRVLEDLFEQEIEFEEEKKTVRVESEQYAWEEEVEVIEEPSVSGKDSQLRELAGTTEEEEEEEEAPEKSEEPKEKEEPEKDPEQESAEYYQRGVASWYGEKFHGRNTANGEVFNMHDPSTAAHTSLPFDTRVRVENLENGKSTVVRINDRGPFERSGGEWVPHSTRVIDLSKAAAQEIGMMGSGLAEVKLYIVD